VTIHSSSNFTPSNLDQIAHLTMAPPRTSTRSTCSSTPGGEAVGRRTSTRSASSPSAKSGVVSGAGGVASPEGPSCSKRSKSGKPTPDVSTKRSPVRPPTIAATGSDVPVAAGPAAAATSAGASSSKKSGTASAFSSEKSGGDVYYTVGPLFASAAPATSIGKAAKQKSPKPLWPLPVKGDQRWA
jgi:hypothetical protein